jgi:hypothetical protein
MYLIELLLPLYDNQARPFGAGAFAAVRRELVERFGGVTAHAQAPAQGLWEDANRRVQRDEVIVFEVMAEALDRDWWSAFRRRLEREFRQQELVIRATDIQKL